MGGGEGGLSLSDLVKRHSTKEEARVGFGRARWSNNQGALQEGREGMRQAQEQQL